MFSSHSEHETEDVRESIQCAEHAGLVDSPPRSNAFEVCDIPQHHNYRENVDENIDELRSYEVLWKQEYKKRKEYSKEALLQTTILEPQTDPALSQAL
jgi:hypothetical protein